MERVSVPPALLAFVEKHMEAYQCGAHHFDHVLRVCGVAQRLAAKEGGNQKIAVVGALCHDVLDSKLLAKEDAAGTERVLVDALSEDASFLNQEEVAAVMHIVKNIGYRRLLDPAWFNNIGAQSIELRCVQDADSLDAIGAIGVARCFAFGGKRNRPLFDLGGVIGADPLSPAAYAQAAGSGVEHFFEKLLRLPAMMVTASGRDLAQARQAHMLRWLGDLDDELAEGGVEGLGLGPARGEGLGEGRGQGQADAKAGGESLLRQNLTAMNLLTL